MCSVDPNRQQAQKPSKKPLTLCDIIPPPSHVRSVLKSIVANAADIQLSQARPRVNSESSARFALENVRSSVVSVHSRTHSRPPSGISFTGFDSFEEVRRGFEFHNNRPAFYPPPVASNNRRGGHMQPDSLFSEASVSSYGNLTKDLRNRSPFGNSAPRAAILTPLYSDVVRLADRIRIRCIPWNA
ncbi:hypothetical protein C8R46DRAFT_146232 [Mycena filopes]|nr:hypothetical protein C8R46DRAFT_146232 [Mycena filopes]